VLGHRRCLRELPHPDQVAATPEIEENVEVEPIVAPVQELPILTRTRERYQAITELRAGGASISAIAHPGPGPAHRPPLRPRFRT